MRSLILITLALVLTTFFTGCTTPSQELSWEVMHNLHGNHQISAGAGRVDSGAWVVINAYKPLAFQERAFVKAYSIDATATSNVRQIAEPQLQDFGSGVYGCEVSQEFMDHNQEVVFLVYTERQTVARFFYVKKGNPAIELRVKHWPLRGNETFRQLIEPSRQEGYLKRVKENLEYEQRQVEDQELTALAKAEIAKKR